MAKEKENDRKEQGNDTYEKLRERKKEKKERNLKSEREEENSSL